MARPTLEQGREAQRRWRKKRGPRAVRNANLKKYYGITIEEFDAMLEAQGGVCAICAGPPMGKGQYHVDHCHETGRVRGLTA